MILNSENWEQDVYNGPLVPGLRLIIRGDNVLQGDYMHVCGGDGGVTHPECPNCRRALFPVLDLDAQDPLIHSLNLWNLERFVVYVCPSCALYMQPYWVFMNGSPIVCGGELDGGSILQDVIPDGKRSIEFVPLIAEDYPTTEELAVELSLRKRHDGVYHQLGGVPFRGGYDELPCCKCKCPMNFAGCVDYDDLNVPLYEGEQREPTALIIGDRDCLNIFTCKDCACIGVKWNT